MNKSYANWKFNYPNHIIIKKEGCFYRVKGNDAKLINELLNYKIIDDFYYKLKVGSPTSDKIKNVLQNNKVNYIIIENNSIVEKKEYDTLKTSTSETKINNNFNNYNKKLEVVELYDIVTVKHRNNNNKEYKFEIVNQYTQQHSVFSGFGKFGSFHKEIIDSVENDSKNTSHEIDRQIPIEAGIGKALINKKIGDITKTNTDVYEIIDIIKYKN